MNACELTKVARTLARHTSACLSEEGAVDIPDCLPIRITRHDR